MPRRARFVISGIAHHVIQRGHNQGQPTGTPRFVDEIERKLGIRIERREEDVHTGLKNNSVPFLRPDLARSAAGGRAGRGRRGPGRGVRTRRVVLVVVLPLLPDRRLAVHGLRHIARCPFWYDLLTGLPPYARPSSHRRRLMGAPLRAGKSNVDKPDGGMLRRSARPLLRIAARYHRLRAAR